MSEVQLTTESIRRFRQAYVAAFGAPTRDDRALRGGERGPALRRHGALAAALPRAARHALRLRAGRAGRASTTSPRTRPASALAQVKDYYDARKRALGQPQAGVAPYKPLPPDALYLGPRNGPSASTQRSRVARLTPFAHPGERRAASSSIAGAARAATSSPSGPRRATNVFEAAVAHVRALQEAGAARDARRLVGRLARAPLPRPDDHGLTQTKPVGAARRRARRCRRTSVPVAVWGLEAGLRGRRPRRHRRAGHPRRPARARRSAARGARRTSSPRSRR